MAPGTSSSGDDFFSADQIRRLTELMAHWRRARDTRVPFPSGEQAELEALVAEELRAAGARAERFLPQ